MAEDAQPRVPRVGEVVLWSASGHLAGQVNQRRKDAYEKVAWHVAIRSGAVVHTGNLVNGGEVYPLVVVRVWSPTCVNGQVLLDGNDTLWVTSAAHGTKDGQWFFPEEAED